MNRVSALFASLDEPPPELPHITDAVLRTFHRSIYDAFARKPDSANILQGVRTFRKGRPHVRVVMVPSPKNGGAFIPCEGRLEARATGSFEIDPDVVRYRAQPFSIQRGYGQGYVPDFVIEHPNGTFTIVDVKPCSRLIDPQVTTRMRYVRHVLGQARLRHRLITDIDLDKQPYRQIRESLRRGSRITLQPFDRHRLIHQLGDRGLPLQALRKTAGSLGLSPYSAEKLALLGDITFPINSQWSETKLLEVNHGNHQTLAATRGTVRDVRITL